MNDDPNAPLEVAEQFWEKCWRTSKWRRLPMSDQTARSTYGRCVS
jgi:hypothetical protein